MARKADVNPWRALLVRALKRGGLEWRREPSPRVPASTGVAIRDAAAFVEALREEILATAKTEGRVHWPGFLVATVVARKRKRVHTPAGVEVVVPARKRLKVKAVESAASMTGGGRG